MPITKINLKKFKVNELKDVMRENKIKGLSGNKAQLITRILDCPMCDEILKGLTLPEKKKRTFSVLQLENQKKFAERMRKPKPEPKIDIVAEERDNQVDKIILKKKPKEKSDVEKFLAGEIDHIPKQSAHPEIKPIRNIGDKHKKKEECVVCFNDTDLLVAKIVSASYNKRKDRPREIQELKYVDSLSTDLVAHYENVHIIILGIHGADDLKLTGIAINSFISENRIFPTIEAVCKKLDSLLNVNKEVMVGGHSIGGFAINHCVEKEDYPYKFISYGAYAPRKNRRWSRNRVRKHLYTTDWLSNNLIKEDNNVIVYENKLSPNTHGLFNYLDKDKMNKNLVTDNSKKTFLETLTKENKTLRKIIKLFSRKKN